MVNSQRPSSGNLTLALEVLRYLARAGVQEICLCAGARNSPLVELLTRQSSFRIFHFFEERSAAFFALGRIKAHGYPVAVVTTSGTAAAELLPAAIEAYYTGESLILITADRPRRYRGTGAPQSIEQKAIFGIYTPFANDFDAADPVAELLQAELEKGAKKAPHHLNLCFEEPLIDRECTDAELQFEVPQVRGEQAGARFALVPAPIQSTGQSHGQFNGLQNAATEREKIEKFLSDKKLPLVLVGGLEKSAREAVQKFLLKLGAPVYLEATSGLREVRSLQDLSLISTDRILERLPQMKTKVDGVLRIGGVPTLRFWRDLEERRADLPVLSVSSVPYAGMTRSELAVGDVEFLLSDILINPPVPASQFSDLLHWDRRLTEQLTELLRAEPTSEPGMIYALSRKFRGKNGALYLGNSLPIREWDLVAERETSWTAIAANRGANGIDGQLSTFYGFAQENGTNWAVLGDLTTLYDLAAPWVLKQRPGIDARLVIVNNGGGRIFSRMFQNRAFQNEHAMGFESWAKMWGLTYERWDRLPETGGFEAQVIEICPELQATQRFWAEYDQRCRMKF